MARLHYRATARQRKLDKYGDVPVNMTRLTVPGSDVQQRSWIICVAEVKMGEKSVLDRRYAGEFRAETARLANSLGGTMRQHAV